MQEEHPKIGQLWVRKTRTGRSVLVGYIWLNSKRRNGMRETLVIRIEPNRLKTTEKAADYSIHNWTKTYEQKKRSSLLDSHPGQIQDGDGGDKNQVAQGRRSRKDRQRFPDGSLRDDAV